MPEHPTGQAVLVVEDDAARQALVLLLGTEGYAVSAAANGQEALAFLRTRPPPDLILLDLMMPVMEGYEFRRVQRQDAALAPIPVVVLTGLGEEAERPDLLGEVGYVLKPVDEGLLFAVIRRFLAAQRPEVLVVDDESGVRQMLDVALTHYGFQVRLAATGTEAVEVYRANRQTIALVLLDVQIPGMDGPATLAALLLGLAEIENEFRRERQAAGIEQAKKKGRYKGRANGTLKGNPQRVRELRDKGLTAPEISTALGISLRTVWRYTDRAGSGSRRGATARNHTGPGAGS